MLQFIKTTILGGILFLIPGVLLIVIFQHAHRIITKVGAPVIASLPFERVFGIAINDLLSIIVLLLICFLAGLIAMTPAASRTASLVERMFLSKVPVYDVAKIKLTTPLRFEGEGSLPTLLVRFDDQWQIGLEIERKDNKVVVYIPGAPDPWAGAVSIVTEDRVTLLPAGTQDTMIAFKQLGKGTSKLLST